MIPKPLIVLDGMRVDINGIDFLIILTPFRSDDHEQAMKTLNQLIAVQDQCVICFASLRPDSTLTVLAPEGWKEEIRARKFSASQLKKIPIYEADLKKRF